MYQYDKSNYRIQPIEVDRRAFWWLLLRKSWWWPFWTGWISKWEVISDRWRWWRWRFRLVLGRRCRKGALVCRSWVWRGFLEFGRGGPSFVRIELQIARLLIAASPPLPLLMPPRLLFILEPPRPIFSFLVIILEISPSSLRAMLFPSLPLRLDAQRLVVQ